MAGQDPFKGASRITHHASRFLLARDNLNPQLSTLNSPVAFPQSMGQPGGGLAVAADRECFDQ